jgi:hypothetical protein
MRHSCEANPTIPSEIHSWMQFFASSSEAMAFPVDKTGFGEWVLDSWEAMPVPLDVGSSFFVSSFIFFASVDVSQYCLTRLSKSFPLIPRMNSSSVLVILYSSLLVSLLYLLTIL